MTIRTTQVLNMNPQDIMNCNTDELTRLKDSYKYINSNYETFKKIL